MDFDDYDMGDTSSSTHLSDEIEDMCEKITFLKFLISNPNYAGQFFSEETDLILELHAVLVSHDLDTNDYESLLEDTTDE